MLNDREERYPAPDVADHLAFRLFVFASTPYSPSPVALDSRFIGAVHSTAWQIAVDQLIGPALFFYRRLVAANDN